MILLPVLAVLSDHETFSSSNYYVSMFHEMWGHLVQALEAKYQLKYVTSQEEVEQLLGEDNSIRVVLALTSSSADPVKSSGFLQRGGALIFCGPMASLTTCDRFAATFSKLELPWEYDSYYRANFYPGPAGSQIGLPEHSHSAKSNVLGKVPSAHIVYGPTEQSFLQSLVFAPESVANPEAATAALGAAGGGWVGYVGDVNGEPVSTPIVLAMLCWAESQAH